MQLNISHDFALYVEADLDTRLASATPVKDAFTMFPNAVARDPEVTAQLLVLLAYRATFADDASAYALNERNIQKKRIVKNGAGLGVNAIRKAIALGIRLDLMDRHQPDRGMNGRWTNYAVDELKLPPCGEFGCAGRSFGKLGSTVRCR